MLITLLEVSLCLESVVCGLICCKVIVIYGGSTLYYSFVSSSVRSNRNNMCVAICARIKIFFIMFFYNLYRCLFIYIAVFLYNISFPLPLAIGY